MYIYEFINKINGKRYIGSSRSDDLKQRYKQHISIAFGNPNHDKYNYPLYCAFRKYGLENFQYDYLDDNFQGSEEELRLKEQYYIDYYNTVCPNGYNQTRDTLHPINDKNTYKKISETKRDKGKRVCLIDENNNVVKIWRCAADCGEELGLYVSDISECCAGHSHTVKGKKFCWVDDNDNPILMPYVGHLYKGIKKEQPNQRMILQINYFTNIPIRSYPSISEAGRINNYDCSALSAVCRGEQKTAMGYKWRYTTPEEASKIKYVEDYRQATIAQISKESKPVVQLDKNHNIIAIYNSVGEAAKAISKTSRSSIARVADHKPNYNTCKGYYWEWKENIIDDKK